jgi:Uma2 family endonuclease
MSISIQKPPQSEIVYPDSDGKPIADNTLQFRWIVTIKEGLDRMFHDRPDVFVARDLLWYPVEGKPEICTAPDALVAFNRPKGDRGSYKQWEEGGIAPQVVFEVRSPNSRFQDFCHKLKFYEQFGVEEYYHFEPDHAELLGWRRGDRGLEEMPAMNDWTSPRLGTRFDQSGTQLRIFRPDARPSQTYQELAKDRDRIADERDRIVEERDQLALDADAERQRADRLAAQLRSLGIEPAP